MIRWPYACSILAALITVCHAAAAKAEYCDMVGLNDSSVAWYYVPPEQMTESTIFMQPGLVEIGREMVLSKNMASIQLPPCYVKKTCAPNEDARWHDILSVDGQKMRATECAVGGKRGCWDLSEGSLVKVLGYQTVEKQQFVQLHAMRCGYE